MRHRPKRTRPRYLSRHPAPSIGGAVGSGKSSLVADYLTSFPPEDREAAFTALRRSFTDHRSPIPPLCVSFANSVSLRFFPSPVGCLNSAHQPLITDP